jgi:hypothetical protein
LLGKGRQSKADRRQSYYGNYRGDFHCLFPGVWDGLSPTDLLRDFSESPVTAVSPGAEGTPLVKGR